MYKYLIAALIGLISITAQAQQSSIAMSVSAADDTLVNADTGYVTTGTGISLEYDNVFALTITRVTGTIGTSNAILQGYDGVEWVTLASSTGAEISGQYQEDTASVTNSASATYRWKVSKPHATYIRYRFRVITTGTQTCAITGRWYYLRRQD